MKKISLILSAALVLTLLAGCKPDNKVKLPVGERASDTMTYTYWKQDVERLYYYYIPSTYQPGTRLPLVLALHGSGANALSQLYESDMEALAEREGFIVVAPNAVGVHSDGTLSSVGNTLSTIGRTDGSFLRWNATPDDIQNVYEVDDVQYLSDLIDRFVDYGYADPARVYSTGLSHGAFMSIRLALEVPEKIAGIGAVSGLLVNKFEDMEPSGQVKLVFVQGTADPVVPMTGMAYDMDNDGTLDFNYALSLDDTIDWFMEKYGLETADVVKASLEDTVPEDGCTIDRYAYVDGSGNVPIVKYLVNNGGHTWPGGTQYSPSYYIGLLCKDAQASELIWNELKDVKK
ncbi:MAG: hypothetical protein PUB51_04700 [Oscillospiraceae bacterium]|nr:hypothetical protein [Oscillospiraceae bacterium]